MKLSNQKTKLFSAFNFFYFWVYKRTNKATETILTSLDDQLWSLVEMRHENDIEFRDDVYAEVTQMSKSAGIRWRRFPILTELLKGHRRGELTIFTGPTGSGKTTFISEYSLDLCMQNVNTLWGSFEIRNVRLVKMMLQQFSGTSLAHVVADFPAIADEFEKLPMYFLTFHGHQSVKVVLDVSFCVDVNALFVYVSNEVIIPNVKFHIV